MLNVETFDNLRGGSVLYKALVHPLAAEGLHALAASLNQAGSVAIYDPLAMAEALLALMPRIDREDPGFDGAWQSPRGERADRRI
jgi:hypothetical protein